jgi:hypothetical protein
MQACIHACLAQGVGVTVVHHVEAAIQVHAHWSLICGQGVGVYGRRLAHVPQQCARE